MLRKSGWYCVDYGPSLASIVMGKLFEFSSRSWLLSDIGAQIGGAYRSAASGWVVATTLISVSLLLVHLRCQYFSGGTTASTSATHVLAFVDSPYTKEASHVESLPLAVAPVPDMCADECLRKIFGDRCRKDDSIDKHQFIQLEPAATRERNL